MIPKGNDIANELQELIPGAHWPQQVPLSAAPAGYFEALPELILHKVRQVDVREELESLSNLLAGVPKIVPFSVPEGYFEQLPSQLRGLIPCEVNDELAMIAPGLADVPRKSPLSSPGHIYFEQLSAQILLKVQSAEEEPVPDLPKAMPFSLPEGYFEQFPAQMLQLVQDEPVLNLPKAMPFSIREGYFEQFPSGMMEHIRDEATVSPFAELTKTVPFSMPAGYFEQLPAQVMDNIRKDEVREELAAISPLLASVPKSVPFSVPAGYFEQLDASVAAIASKPATVINLRPRRMMIYKWVAAACLIALASTSTLYFMRNNNYRETSTTPAVNLAEVNLSEVSDQEIIDYLQTHMDAFDKENLMGYSTEAESTPLPASTDLSTEAIEHYLENTSLLKEQSPTRN